MDKEKAILNSLQFDRAFLDRIKFVEKQKRMTKAMHGNGVPFHYICIFKKRRLHSYQGKLEF